MLILFMWVCQIIQTEAKVNCSGGENRDFEDGTWREDSRIWNFGSHLEKNRKHIQAQLSPYKLLLFCTYILHSVICIINTAVACLQCNRRDEGFLMKFIWLEKRHEQYLFQESIYKKVFPYLSRVSNERRNEITEFRFKKRVTKSAAFLGNFLLFSCTIIAAVVEQIVESGDTDFVQKVRRLFTFFLFIYVYVHMY